MNRRYFRWLRYGSKLPIQPRGEMPRHWLDNKHEPDGTNKSHIETHMSRREVSCRLHVDTSVPKLYFKTGANEGAQTLTRLMSSIDQDQYECDDDMSGSVLDEKMVRAGLEVQLPNVGVRTQSTIKTSPAHARLDVRLVGSVWFVLVLQPVPRHLPLG